jgi:hypothetical protein
MSMIGVIFDDGLLLVFRQLIRGRLQIATITGVNGAQREACSSMVTFLGHSR